jgi:hypothetical protein
MERLEVNGAVRPLKWPLGVKWLNKELSADDIIGEANSIAGTGAKTTPITCWFVPALLCEHQDIQDRVLEEQ